ncbi:Ubiquitin carboxyl-terminal hydrolase 21 [Acorus gramineus]|uniref:Ubiquitin carboxyl-terminal hydrolase 21 n=1 Tax=Acorus gramineus TaxID=55184 RepID=A0AAV9BQG3_ACOGR|nr:Ubiquitin carboxyl-terminal hydrolase 21 [Acorus gramineus]
MNSVLQCITHTVPFVERLSSILSDHQMSCQSGRVDFCSICALHKLVKRSIACSGSIVSPNEFSRNLTALRPTFKSFNQEDAHEFLIGLLENLKSCGSLNGASENLVAPIFEGSLNHQMLCSGCGHGSATPEPLHGLSLAIDKSDSLLDALKFFMIVERLEGLTCDECKMTVAKDKWYTFDEAPLVVSFHLKRFSTESNNIQKIDKFVEFPLELNLQPFHGGTQENKEKKKITLQEEILYNLYAVVVHIGSCGSGHYISYVRPSPGLWYQLNDSEVSQVSAEEVLKQNAYLLFYIRQTSPWFSSYMDKLGKDSSRGSIIENEKNVCAIPQTVKPSRDTEQIITESLKNLVTVFGGFSSNTESLSTAALYKEYPGIDSSSAVASGSGKPETKADSTAADAISGIPSTPPPAKIGSTDPMWDSGQSSGSDMSDDSMVIP